jgi:chorismate mutase
MDIDDWRRKIDEIDAEILKLLNERARCTVEIGKIKGKLGLPIFVPEREREVLKAVEQGNSGPLSNAAVRRLFERIIDESRALEKEHREGKDGS